MCVKLGTLTAICQLEYYIKKFETYPTRAFQDIWIIWIIVSFTIDSNVTKSIAAIHICFTLPLWK